SRSGWWPRWHWKFMVASSSALMLRLDGAGRLAFRLAGMATLRVALAMAGKVTGSRPSPGRRSGFVKFAPRGSQGSHSPMAVGGSKPDERFLVVDEKSWLRRILAPTFSRRERTSCDFLAPAFGWLRTTRPKVMGPVTSAG